MTATVICPAHRPGIAALTDRLPAVLLPLLGRNLLDRRLSALFTSGLRDIRLTAADRPELVRQFLRHGEPWGLQADLIPVAEESPGADNQELLDRLPGAGESAFTSYRAWFEAIQAAFSSREAQRLGMREVAKDVWVHMRANVHHTAKLIGPCWIGERVYVGPGAHVGPDAFIEDNSFIESSANLRNSWVGPNTYVGAFTELLESLAWGRTLCKWTTGDVTQVADSFLLSELRPTAARGSTPWIARLAALAIAVATTPILLVALVASLIQRRPFLLPREAVLPDGQSIHYAELASLPAGWRRWPRLLQIVRGRFAWFGNPPLSRHEAAQLEGEFEQMWLKIPPGLVTLADAMGCAESIDEETKAHAGYYAACHGFGVNVDIIRRLFLRALNGTLAIFAGRTSRTHEDLCFRPHSPSK